MRGIDVELVGYFKKGQNRSGQYCKYRELEESIDSLTYRFKKYRRERLNGGMDASKRVTHVRILVDFIGTCKQQTPEMALLYIMSGTAYKMDNKGSILNHVVRELYGEEYVGVLTDLQYMIEEVIDHRDRVVNLTYSWLKSHRHSVVDNQQPKGRCVYLDDNYRVYENGVVQTLKGKGTEEVYMNMVGTNETDKYGRSNIHFTKVDGIHEHVFLSKEELVAACFLPDPEDGTSKVVYKDKTKPLTSRNLAFATGNVASNHRTREEIYKRTGYEVPKYQGIASKELSKDIYEAVSREVTNGILRTLKNKHATTAKDYYIVLFNKRVSMITKYAYVSNRHIKEGRPVVILDMELFWDTKTERLKITQPQFHQRVNNELQQLMSDMSKKAK